MNKAADDARLDGVQSRIFPQNPAMARNQMVVRELFERIARILGIRTEGAAMKQHGSMNRRYRLVWSQRRQGWVVAPETASGGSGRAVGSAVVASTPQASKRRAVGALGGMALAAGLMLGGPGVGVAVPLVEAEGDVTPKPDEGTSVWQPSGALIVGDAGSGTLTITGGGQVTQSGGNVVVGNESTSTGTITVSGVRDGVASKLDLTGPQFYVGLNGKGTLTIEDGGQVMHRGESTQVGRRDGSTGTITVSGARDGIASKLDLRGNFFLGSDEGSQGTLTVLDGAQVTQGGGDAWLGYNPGSTGTITVSGVRDGVASTLDSTGPNFYVGHSGNGTLTITDGGQVTHTGPEIRVGYRQGSTGTIRVSGVQDGVASKLDLTSGLFYLGQIGNGTLTVEDGGWVTQSGDSIVVGYQTNSTGTITVSGARDGMASRMDLRGDFYVGSDWGSQGTLTVLDGAQVTHGGGNAWLGYDSGSTGKITLSGVRDGVASTLDLTGGHFLVGHSGNGTLTIEDGGQVTHSGGNVIVGNGSTAEGTITVSGVRNGVASKLDLTGLNFHVGYSGNGTLKIEEGAQVSASGLQFGVLEGSTGTLEVSGTQEGLPAQLTAHGFFLVGHSGTGTFKITAGGRVEQSGGLQMGGAALVSTVDGSVLHRGQGDVEVSGAGSQLTLGGALRIGGAGAGMLSLTNGGLVVVPAEQTVTIAGAGPSTGTLILGAAEGDPAIAAGRLDAAQVRFGAGDGHLLFNHTGNPDGSAHVFSAALSGAGALHHANGVTHLTADSTAFTGTADVSGGTLVVDGKLPAASLTVRARGTLAGQGTVGATVVEDGGRLAPGDTGGTLHVAGDLSLAPGASLEMALGRPGSADQPASGISERIAVAGDLALNGTVHLTQSAQPADGSVGLGYYRLLTYDGTLTANTATLGSTPALAEAQYELQAGAGRVDLFIQGPDSGGEPGEPQPPGVPGDSTLQHWQGGSGTWSPTASAWRNQGGDMAVAWAGNHAVFRDAAEAQGGVVTVEGELSFQGLQFVDEGFQLVGPGSLATVANGSEIRVLADQAEIAVALTGSGALRKTEAGTLVLRGANTYTGGTQVERGALVGDANAIRGPIRNAGTVVFEQATDALYTDSIAGLGAQRGQMHKQGEGNLTLAAQSSLDWTVAQGGLVAQAEAFTGDAEVLAGARLTLRHTVGQGSYAGALSGEGSLHINGNAAETDTGNGSGTVVLTGDSSAFTGTTQVAAGTLQLDGRLGGDVQARAGSAITGAGQVSGSLDVTHGGVLAGASGQQLRIAGDVLMDGTTELQAALGAASSDASATLRQRLASGAAASDALFAVGGDLTLDGTLRVQDAGGFGAGVYRLFDYAGTLTDHGLDIAPDSVAADQLRVQTAVAGRVNLVSTANAALGFWDGADPARYDNGVVDGGSGVWRNTGRAWTTADGRVNGASQPEPVFAVFQGQRGTVTVAADQGEVQASGLQFVTDGYRLDGDTLVLAGGAQATVRVGDGTLAGASTQATIATTLAGDTMLVKDDLGRLVLTGANTYTGGTRIEAGTLQLGDGGSTGAVDGLIINDGTLALNRQDVVVLDNSLSGTGVIRQIGSGTVTLNAESAGFSGTTQVEHGTLVVDGTLGGTMQVAAEGRLQGRGTVGSTVVAGTLAPGSVAGDATGASPKTTPDPAAVAAASPTVTSTLRVAGDLVIEAGAVHQATVDARGAADRVQVTGSATLHGGTLQIDAQPGDYTLGSRHTLLTANDGVTGRYAALDVAQPLATPFLAFGLGYDSHTVQLQVERSDLRFAAVGRTPNQRAAGAGLDSTPITQVVHTALAQLDTDTAASALDQVAGELQASVMGALIEDSRFVRQAALERLRAGTGDATPGATSGEQASYRLGAVGQAVAPDHAGPVFWAQGFGARGTTDGDGNAAELERNSGGLLLGVDQSLGDWRLGLLAGYGQTRVKSPDRAASATSRNVHLGAYGGTAWGALALRLGAAYSWHDVKTQRAVVFPGFAGHNTAKNRARTVQAFGELGYSLPVGSSQIEPFAQLAHVRSRTPHYTEDGSAAALSGKAEAHTTFTTLGMRLGHDWQMGSRTAQVSGTVGWRHAVGPTLPSATHALQDGSPFTVTGAPIARNSLVLEAGLGMQLAPLTTLQLSYSGQLASQARDHGVKARLAVRF